MACGGARAAINWSLSDFGLWPLRGPVARIGCNEFVRAGIDDTNSLRCGPPAPADGAFATQTAPMRRRVFIHLFIFDTIAAINLVYPAPMTTLIAYAAVPGAYRR